MNKRFWKWSDCLKQLEVRNFKIIVEKGSRGTGTNPFPSTFFSRIPLRNSQIPFPFLIFDIFFPFPVTKSQSQCGLNPIFPGQNLPTPIPILPLQGPLKINVWNWLSEDKYLRVALTKWCDRGTTNCYSLTTVFSFTDVIHTSKVRFSCRNLYSNALNKCMTLRLLGSTDVTSVKEVLKIKIHLFLIEK